MRCIGFTHLVLLVHRRAKVSRGVGVRPVEDLLARRVRLARFVKPRDRLPRAHHAPRQVASVARDWAQRVERRVVRQRLGGMGGGGSGGGGGG